MTSGQAGSAPPLRILVAEDSRTQAQRLRNVLQRAGYQVEVAGDGQSALQCLQERVPDLVITDVNMPGMDGYELAQRIKSAPGLRRTPVLLVTSMSEPQDVIQGLQCRADGFVLKPYEDEYLLARIRDVLANGRFVALEEEETVDIVFNGVAYRVPAGRTQALNLLLSTYEAAIKRSRELARSKDALARQAEQLAQRTAEADAANQAKSLFLATMSHEIRTPMNGMLGMLELLERTPLDAGQRDTLDIIRESSAALLRIVNDILDFSKIEAGQMEIRPEPVSIADLVRALERRYAGAASAKGVALHIDVDPHIPRVLQLDGVRLRQILDNFISNALKFTERGAIELAVTVLEPRAGAAWLQFEVSDSGLGISDEVQRQLFQPFRQGDAPAARKAGGTGLGLTICRRLAGLMGGAVHLASEPGRGTTVTLELPADPTDLALPNAEPAAGAGARAASLRMLVVDDHATNRIVLTRQLQALGFEAQACDGHEALERWQEGAFELVLTDCEMPGMNGFDLARAIRAAESATARQRCVVIACTAHALAGVADECRAAGMDDVLVKPVTLATLGEMLARWLPVDVDPAPPPPEREEDGALLDLQLITAFWGGDPGLLHEVLGSFRASVRRDGQALREAVQARDAQAVARLAHMLLGSSRMVGAAEVAQACERLRVACEAQDWTGVALAHEELERAWARLEAWLRSTEWGTAPAPAPHLLQ